jgi:uncharacterized SAM-binding protein YcdF (DUF218 family)
LILAGVLVGALLLAAGRLRAGRWLTITAGMALLVFGLLPTATFLARPLETRFPKPELPDRVDGIVLLSGSERPVASQAYAEPQVGSHGGRYITTLLIAASHPEARIVYTGGPRYEPGKGALETQTAVAAAILSGVGIDPSRVSIEEGSADTCENASNSFRFAGPSAGEAWVVVTSAAHMPRTVACFRAAGWDIIPYPADYHSDPPGWGVGRIQIGDNLALLDLAVHEWIGLAFYRLSGRTKDLFPGP